MKRNSRFPNGYEPKLSFWIKEVNEAWDKYTVYKQFIEENPTVGLSFNNEAARIAYERFVYCSNKLTHYTKISSL